MFRTSVKRKTEYRRIKKAIPQKWETILQSENLNDDNQEIYLKNTKHIEIFHDKCFVYNQETPYTELKTKEVYFHLLYPQKQPSCMAAWNAILPKWDTVFKSLLNSIQENKVKVLHWKCIHRAIYSECRLKVMQRSNGYCKLCVIEEETTIHLFYKCKEISVVWEKLQNYIFEKTDRLVKITETEVLFGIQSIDDKKLSVIIDFMICKAKWQIWKNRNCVKYGNKQSLSCNEIFETTVNSCKDKLKVAKVNKKGTPLLTFFNII
jgi:hypothetical protein